MVRFAENEDRVGPRSETCGFPGGLFRRGVEELTVVGALAVANKMHNLLSEGGVELCSGAWRHFNAGDDCVSHWALRGNGGGHEKVRRV